jgi:hypothetical protein
LAAGRTRRTALAREGLRSDHLQERPAIVTVVAAEQPPDDLVRVHQVAGRGKEMAPQWIEDPDAWATQQLDLGHLVSGLVVGVQRRVQTGAYSCL